MADTKIPRAGARVSLRSNRSISVLRIPSQSRLSHAYSHSSLHRSVSQLMDLQDKKVLVDDSLWETIMGHDSGLVSGCLPPEPSLNIRADQWAGGGAGPPAPDRGCPQPWCVPLTIHPSIHPGSL